MTDERIWVVDFIGAGGFRKIYENEDEMNKWCRLHVLAGFKAMVKVMRIEKEYEHII